jgi:hypothetical protein
MANQRKSSKKYKMKKRGGSKSKTMKKGGWPWDKPDPNAPPAKFWWPFGSSDSKTSILSASVVKPADPVVKSVAPPAAPSASTADMSNPTTMGGKQQSKKSKKSKK